MREILVFLVSLVFSHDVDSADKKNAGKASTFYPQEKYNNGIFACGGDEWEDENLPICAYRNRETPRHQKIPCGAWILVKNRSTNNTYMCKVMDRGPYGKIDEEGNWFNGALDWKEHKKAGKPLKKGYWRAILDMSPLVTEKIGSPGMAPVSVYWWRDNPWSGFLDSLYPELEY